MKVLIVMGSLRKKNTYQTLKKIESYSSENIDFEYLILKDMDFKQCNGCHLCISHGEDQCPLSDDRDLIIEKIESADGVILSSPNYVKNVNWLMKNYIDRFAYTLHRPKYFKQKFMLLITSGDIVGAKDALKSLSVVVSGGKVTSKLRAYFSPGMSQKKKDKQEIRIEKEAKKFYRSLKTDKAHKPPIMYLMWFAVFKVMSMKNKDNLIADYEFYKDKDYFVQVKLNIFQRAVVKFFSAFFKLVT